MGPVKNSGRFDTQCLGHGSRGLLGLILGSIELVLDLVLGTGFNIRYWV